MSTTLREFLRQHAEKHRGDEEAAKAALEEWRGAVLAYQRLQDFLEALRIPSSGAPQPEIK